MEDMINDRVSQKENELNATYDERLRNYEERLESNWSQVLALNFYREQDLQRQVSLTKSQLRELRMSNEDSQAKLVNHSSKQGAGKCVALNRIHRQFNRPGSRCKARRGGYDGSRP